MFVIVLHAELTLYLSYHIHYVYIELILSQTDNEEILDDYLSINALTISYEKESLQ